MRDKIDKVSKVLIEMNRKFGQDTLAIWQRIDTNKLQQTLAADFIENGIDLQFNYGVVNEDSNTITYSKSKKEITELQNSKYRVHLFPNKLFASPEMLVVNFHGKLNYIFATLWPLVLCSFVLTLIVILGIFYTIHTIIRQKKLADIKNDFINNMTHEFKTPIATIGIATDTLKNPRVYSDHEKMSFYTDIIKQENERMNKQVSKVLQMAQIDKGEVKYSYETVNVHDLLEHIVQSVQLQVEQKEGKITYINEAKNYFLSADITHFGNTLNNLIDNAIKYAPVKPDIKIKMWNTGDSLLISIKDNGMGMNSDIQKRIFDKFYRATTGNLHDVKGFGLGLSYAKAIVDDMSGFINVESAPDKGSTFTVILPLSANNVSEEKNITNETLVS
ncbi:MAG: HAMP domain-containing histidine kinase [Bacteroidetes bacterium]|nr:HAMP domain-containing histidine kinase [Bacteroidota bacterium]